MSSFGWRARRLAMMSAGEIASRTGRTLVQQAERAGWFRASSRPARHEAAWPAPWFALDPEGIDRDAIVAAARRIAAGRFDVLSLRDAPLGFPPDWLRDPRTGIRTPSDRFGKAIDYRRKDRVGDVKYLWELSRHLELVTLAQAWRIERRPEWLEACARYLASWFDACPYPMGPHWASSLESGFRLVNHSVAWHLLGGHASPLFEGSAGDALRERWLTQVYWHGHFIRGHLSLHSSANNHLLGELLGLLVCGVTWPVFGPSARWTAFALRHFEQEALKQTAPDGVNREQAVYYQHAVMDMMLVAEAVAAGIGRPFGAAFAERLDRMATYLEALLDAGGHMPMWGDADDAALVRWDPAPRDAFRPLLAVMAARTDRADLWAASGAPTDKARWLLGSRADDSWARCGAAAQAPGARARPQASFPNGGMHVLGTAFGTPREVRMVVDCAPLGYLSIAAHAHADALAVTLSAWGEPLLVDAGTYAYHTDPLLRDHFRSTSAHNTATVDGLDQSEIGGPFLWLRKARATLRRLDLPADDDRALQVFEGEHDGWRRLPEPLTHRRRIAFDPAASTFEITDTFECTGEHRIMIGWQFAEAIDVELADDGGVIARGARGTLRMRCDAGWQAQALRGSDDPIAGWVSPAFDVRLPATQVRFLRTISGTTSVTTHIALHPDEP